MNTVSATTILNLLLKKHSDDITVPECKAGPTWSARRTPRFDLWAMKRSYTKPNTWIYEIKVSRSDFLQDDKWQAYLPYCKEFYFVSPAGIIDPAEVPEMAGLLLSSKNGTRLYCKKKAPYRNVEIPVSLFKYILMSRTKIVSSAYSNTNNDNSNNIQRYSEQWFADKTEKQELGRNVSRKIRQLYDKNVKLVKVKQDQLECRIEKLEDTKTILKKMGFENPNNIGWNREEKIRDRVAEINAGFPEKDVIKHLDMAVLDLQNTIKVIKGRGKK